MEEDGKKKAHRATHSGRKAQKKKMKNPHVQDMNAKQRNPKAFAIQSAKKAERQFRRTMDIKSKGHHVPAVDRTPLKPPPAIVAIVGPPKVGKSTLLQCLVKNFTRQNMSSIKGPVTIVSGKKKRMTFIECNNDVNQMIDVAKIADMVLLLIDAKSGFEMETFEFLNICNVHGMPRVMGVLTHLDLFKNKKALQKTKTMLKKRYRTEFPRGEKMFYLSGILHGEYLKNETHNLGRFLSVMKFQLSSWKKSHPYILADRMEDITDPDLIAKQPDCSRTLCLYGYARGTALKKNCFYHIPGCGDYFVKNMHFLPDPCPLPDKMKKRSLNEKERLIYAPMCGIGGVVYDKDAVYIELKGSHSHARKVEESEAPTDNMVSSLMTTEEPIDEKMASVQMSLFSGAQPLDDLDDQTSSEDENSDTDDDDVDSQNDDVGQSSLSSADSSEEDSEDDEDPNQSKEESSATKKRKMSEYSFDCDSSGDDDDGEMDQKPQKKKRKKISTFSDVDVGETTSHSSDVSAGHLKWKDELVQKAANAFYRRQQEAINLQKMVYGGPERKLMLEKDEEGRSEDDEDEVIGGLFRIPGIKKTDSRGKNINETECSKFTTDFSRDWSNVEEMDTIKDCFVTGNWGAEDAENVLQDDEELFGDFEDLDTEAKNDIDAEENSESYSKAEEDGAGKEPVAEKTLQEKRLEKKKRLKELFNAQFDDKEGKSFLDDLKVEADEQGQLNRKEFESLDDEMRVQFEGYRPGLYLRVEIENVPCEFIRNFDPTYPVIVGGLLSGENKMGYLQVRIKKHRWYPKILKTRDPLILSLGWRRFQTIPLYYVTDHNGRNRLLKYTPKHLHCMASFWGPITPQKSGFCAVQTVSEIMSDFRIAAAGSITEVDQSTEIVKKLKLLGNPFEIYRKTAFIEGMFHSPLEVAKYEGAVIRTTSGIRGQIKKALRKPPGIFRATFEDKILMSDIVFLRTWVKVEVPQFCTSVCTLLLAPEQKMKWQGMKTLGRLRFEKNLHAPVTKDSLYVPIERKIRHFAPLVVPKNIQRDLPFQDKIIHLPKKNNNPEDNRVAVVREPHEQEIAKAIKMLKTVHKMKAIKEKRTMRARVKTHRKEKRKDDELRHHKLQEKKKKIMQKKQSMKKKES